MLPDPVRRKSAMNPHLHGVPRRHNGVPSFQPNTCDREVYQHNSLTRYLPDARFTTDMFWGAGELGCVHILLGAKPITNIKAHHDDVIGFGCDSSRSSDTAGLALLNLFQNRGYSAPYSPLDKAYVIKRDCTGVESGAPQRRTGLRSFHSNTNDRQPYHHDSSTRCLSAMYICNSCALGSLELHAFCLAPNRQNRVSWHHRRSFLHPLPPRHQH